MTVIRVVRHVQKMALSRSVATSLDPSYEAPAIPQSGPVLFKKVDDKQYVILDRAKALNSMSKEMCDNITQVIKEYNKRPGLISMFIFKANGEKAFCAGGDVRAVVEKGGNFMFDYFKSGYTVIHNINATKIPWVSLINGINFGGGVGLTTHSMFCVATEKASFAMPETTIGFFPNNAMSYLYPKFEGRVGWYLGLTASRLKGRDAVRVGYASHFVDSDKLNSLEADLLALKNPTKESIKEVLDTYQDKSIIDKDKEFSLAPHLNTINTCFNATEIESIINNLKKDGSAWAQEALKILSKGAPLGLKVAMRIMNDSSKISGVKESLITEYRLVHHFLKNHDFHEGVRAVIIDKDNTPNWKPATFEEVTEEMIQEYFEQLSPEDELYLD